MTQVLLSQPIKKKITKILKAQCKEFKEKNVIPTLKVILVGNNSASLIYTQNKKKYCEKIGAQCDIISLPEDIKPELFLKTIDEINNDKLVDGCIIQLPLPKQLSHLNVGKLVAKEKDIDGFHPENLYSLMSNNESTGYVSCTPKGIATLLNEYAIELAGKNVTIIGRSMIVGKPLALLLTNRNATVTLCHSHTQNLREVCQQADIIIAAIGVPKFVDKTFLSTDKKQVLIDVGISTDANGQLSGDIDFENVFNHVSAITPVPGGVGPMTIVSLTQNLLQAAQNRLSL